MDMSYSLKLIRDPNPFETWEIRLNETHQFSALYCIANTNS